MSHVTLESGLFYGMSDQQESRARETGLHTIKLEDGSWGWAASFGQDFGFASEEEALAAGLDAMDD